MAAVMTAAIAGCSQPPPAREKGTWAPAGSQSASQALLVCNGSTQRCPDAAHYLTVQSAVDAARPGDWILIWPGVYHENTIKYHAGVWITTPDLHIRGLSRNEVIIDGSHGTSGQPCPSSPALQDFNARDGIVVWKASGVTIQNLTVCDYLSGPGGQDGNEIWWDGGDGSGQIGLTGFSGSYLTATSMYHPADIHSQHLAQYGIYVGNAAGPGQITDSYASNMAAGAFYVGACQRVCATVLSDDHGTNSALGYLGTNSGGRMVIKDSVFDDNRTGIAPSSLNNDDAPPPQDGRCPGSATKSCTVIEDNQVSDNNNANAPAYGSIAPGVGIGIELDGSQFDTVTHNTITGNRSWGVIANDSVDTLGHLPHSRCQGGYPNIPAKGLCLLPARGNLIFSNTLRGNGTFANPGNADLGTAGLIAGSAIPRNCFYSNQAIGGQLTSAPAGIEQPGIDGRPCAQSGTGNDPVLLRQLGCSTLSGSCAVPQSVYPPQTMIDFAVLPVLSGMTDPCSGVPRNSFCLAARS
jgi:Periplasmic copper-binding protein (NosD)